MARRKKKIAKKPDPRARRTTAVQRLSEAASRLVALRLSQADQDAEERRDRGARAILRRIGQGWSPHTAAHRRDIIELYSENATRAALGITGHGGEKKAGRKRKRHPPIIKPYLRRIEP